MTENKKFVDIYMPYGTQFSSLKLKYGQIYVTECLKPKSKELHFKIVNKGPRFVFIFLKNVYYPRGQWVYLSQIYR